MTRPHETMKLTAKASEGGEILLMAPEVGNFTGALPRGATLAPGMVCGTLLRLGRAIDLVVPEGAGGAIVGDPPCKLMCPTGFGDVLYRLDPEGVAAQIADLDAAALGLGQGEMAVLANQPGRVWHRPSPDAEAFCGPGDVLTGGSPLCLMEVMKTFSTVQYRAGEGLPARARVVRWMVEDGGDVEPGAPLVTVEPAV